MRIVGFEKNSFVDYPGKIAAVAFAPGCNMNCFYCHNRDILCENKKRQFIDPDKFFQFIAKRKAFLDGVVVSGGEPTLQHDLIEFITEIKKIGYPVKLDTNGTNPAVLEKLIGQRLVDYVAMDIKAPLDKYEEICGTAIPMEKIEQSMNLLLQGKVDYEFRTTFVPQLTEEDGLNIAKRIRGARRYVLQQFRKPAGTTELNDIRLHAAPHSPDLMSKLGEQVKHFVQAFELRGVS